MNNEERDEAIVDAGALPIRISPHPKALSAFAISRLLERVSYYLVRSLLIYYFIDRFRQGDVQQGYGIYTTIVAAAAISFVVGGWLVDRFFTLRKAITWAGLSIAIGYFVLAFGNIFTDVLSAILVIAGLGLYTPAHFTALRKFYAGRENFLLSGVAGYFAAIEAGALIASLLLAYALSFMGWRQGFMIAGILMIAGHIYLLVIAKAFNEKTLRPSKLEEPQADKGGFIPTAVGGLIGFFLAAILTIRLPKIISDIDLSNLRFFDTGGLDFLFTAATMLFLLALSGYYLRARINTLPIIGTGVLVFLIAIIGFGFALSQLGLGGKLGALSIGILVVGYGVFWSLVYPALFATILRHSEAFTNLKIGILNACVSLGTVSGWAFNEGSASVAFQSGTVIIGTGVLTLCGVYLLQKEKFSRERD